MPEANFNRFAKAAACVLKVLNGASPDDALANSRTSNREFRLIGHPAARYRGRAGLLVIHHLERGESSQVPASTSQTRPTIATS